MGHELAAASPAARRVLDEAEAALPGLLRLMWEGPAEKLQLTANQQPALVAAGAAAYAAWLEAGGPPAAMAAGHSLGEYTAHVAAGSLSVSDAVRLVRRRGSYMQEAVPEGRGAMAAVLKLDVQEVLEALADSAVDGEVAEVANLNSPGQTVISGSAAGVAAATEALKKRGGRVIPLKVSAPFHCSLMQPAAERLAHDLNAALFGKPSFPIICNVTAKPVSSAEESPGILTRQVTASVRWTESIQALAELGATQYVEFGSGSVLTGLVGRIVPGARAAAVDSPATLAQALQEERS
jgi:[acyl-carrier-protein] S-malonyltransferase